MTLPFVSELSTERCHRCHKSMRETLGQDADTGWVHTQLSCDNCGTEIRERPRADRTPYVLGVKELLKIRTRHVDRGKTLTPREIALMSRAEFEEWANGAS
jgi:hypothetical protein